MKNMMNQGDAYTSLDARLSWIANQVRPEVCVIDVGTDHARLPIALVQSGKTQQAIAADVAKEPLQQAQKHIEHVGLSAQIETILSDGLVRIDLPEQVDVTICGMGGDTMVNIITAKPQLQRQGVRLLLQPQTEIPLLRLFLAAQGFAMVAETVVYEAKRFYQAWVAVYTGEVREISELEAELGALNVAGNGVVFRQYVQHRQAVVGKWQQAKMAAGQDTALEDGLLHMYAQVLSA